ncbi:glycosyltransferase [Priestia megaterium]|uniref:glycosyltransferase n=1 Tax=Priestia megaterium TaxID=1404 RepID=UPI0021AD1F02|nr:glycosyltransferase [Priestia megaterium]MCR8929540.1 glycosyltransferase [Priestia megaterium]
MKILHYTLGLPPMRSGGLTKYALDLMQEQAKSHEVINLYPGTIDVLNKETRIKLKRHKEDNITHFQIINSLPLPIFKGIREPLDFMRSISKDMYMKFLIQINPDVIHIHTLMGIHQEFFLAAKELKIRLIYTTHDYFGICPTINLYKDSKDVNCYNFNEGLGCVECCSNSLSTAALKLAQTPIYPTIKKLKKIKSKVKREKQLARKSGKFLTNNSCEKDELSSRFVKLREFYTYMFKQVDLFHFNSSVAKEVFQQYLPDIEGRIIDITHKNVKKIDQKKSRSDKIRVGYLGPFKKYKGLPVLVQAFKKLPKEKYELHMYGDNELMAIEDNMYMHGRYSMSELEKIFKKIDVLVVPSLWKETFGFITLEALSHSTPVIISNTVGSKDLLTENKFGWIIETSSLGKLLISLTKEVLERKNADLIADFETLTIEKHSEDVIYNLYRDITPKNKTT